LSNQSNNEILLTFDKDHLDKMALREINQAIDLLDAHGLHLLNSNYIPLTAKVYRTNKAFGVYKNHGLNKVRFANQILAETENEIEEHIKKSQPVKNFDMHLPGEQK